MSRGRLVGLSLEGLCLGSQFQNLGLVEGVLVVGSARPYAFGDSQAELLGALADQAAIAIENARLYADARQLAVLEERNRMAREIHDTLAQGFTGIVHQLNNAELAAARMVAASAASVLMTETKSPTLWRSSSSTACKRRATAG